jgi:hypothetical protein
MGLMIPVGRDVSSKKQLMIESSGGFTQISAESCVQRKSLLLFMDFLIMIELLLNE